MQIYIASGAEVPTETEKYIASADALGNKLVLRPSKSVWKGTRISSSQSKG